MLGRRNLRIKVMQELYAYKMDEAGSLGHLQNHLESMVEKFVALNLVNHAYLAAICAYADTDYQIKSARFIRDENQPASNRLATNAVMEMLTQSPGFQQGNKKYKINHYVDEIVVKNIYQELAKSSALSDYNRLEKITLADDAKILIYLLENIYSCSEEIAQQLEVHFPNFSDDNDYILNNIHKLFSQPAALQAEPFFPTEDSIKEEKDFATQLLSRTFKNDEKLEVLIKPCVANWDIERIAVIDLIIIKMAACELKFFPTIPIKVTMNEYIDIAKYYSTPKSKDFVNGVMDKLKNRMTEEGEIQKTGRGLVDH